MHILATFATLCCQTRWPRNHSCTTQEHVSFFRTFSGHFRKFRLFRDFDTFCEKLRILWKSVQNINSHACTWTKTFSQTRRTRKNISSNVQMCKTVQNTNRQFCKMCKNVSCTKCANLQRKYFSKCRNHKSALCTKTQMQISAEFTILSVHNFVEWLFLFYVWENISLCKNNLIKI